MGASLGPPVALFYYVPEESAVQSLRLQLKTSSRWVKIPKHTLVMDVLLELDQWIHDAKFYPSGDFKYCSKKNPIGLHRTFSSIDCNWKILTFDLKHS